MSRVVVLDGGFSTQLATHVGDKIDGDPLWTARFLATNPTAVYATHLDFLRAGAEIIQTNTYQASVSGFVEHLGMTEEASLTLIEKAVDLAKSAVKEWNGKALIAGSCGPYGASLHDGSEYTGKYPSHVSKEFLQTWHQPRIQALVNSGVDLLALETIPCRIEAEALVDLLKDKYPRTKAWLTFSCRPDGRSIVDGSDFRTVARSCYENSLPGQLIATGINCIAPKAVQPLLEGFNTSNSKFIPLIVYPNSGETYTVSDGWTGMDTTEPLSNFIQEWLNMGVRYVGGCCRTYAGDVTKISVEVEKWQKKHVENSHF